MNPRKFRGNCATGCGRPINNGAKTYCSIKCQHLQAYRQKAALFISGRFPVATNNSRFLRRFLSETIGEKCSRCGWNRRHPVTGRIVVEVEHVDGDFRNNAPSNLTLLCPNCHSLTPTYRGLNRGRGRPGRKGGAPRRNEPGGLARKELLMATLERCGDVQLVLDVGLPT